MRIGSVRLEPIIEMDSSFPAEGFFAITYPD